jgi:hypothetical protein
MKKSFITTTLGILILLLVPVTVFAITVSPPVMEFDVSGGDKVREVVKLINKTNETITLFGTVQNFKALDETGVPAFMPTGELTDLASWIKLEETTVVLAAGEKKDVPFSIDIPADARAGGHFAGILWSGGGVLGVSEKNVEIVFKTGTLLLVRVSGEINEVGGIASFTVDKKFYNYLPINFVVRFENMGGVHLKPVGAIQIKNIFGVEVASIPLNGELANVLPDSIRKFDAVWQKNEVSPTAPEWQKEKENFAWGKYTATLVLNYGVDNQTAMAKVAFWIFPWRVIMFYAVPIIVVILLIIIQGVRGYKERRIKKDDGKAA